MCTFTQDRPGVRLDCGRLGVIDETDAARRSCCPRQRRHGFIPGLEGHAPLFRWRTRPMIARRSVPPGPSTEAHHTERRSARGPAGETERHHRLRYLPSTPQPNRHHRHHGQSATSSHQTPPRTMRDPRIPRGAFAFSGGAPRWPTTPTTSLLPARHNRAMTAWKEAPEDKRTAAPKSRASTRAGTAARGAWRAPSPRRGPRKHTAPCHLGTHADAAGSPGPATTAAGQRTRRGRDLPLPPARTGR